jgi:hypothetical protein
VRSAITICILNAYITFCHVLFTTIVFLPGPSDTD